MLYPKFKTTSRHLSLLVIVLLTITGAAHAKTAKPKSGKSLSKGVQYVLTDPVSGAVLPNTPYVLVTQHSVKSESLKAQLTDAQGRTRAIKDRERYDLNDPKAPVILSRVEGKSGLLVLMSLQVANMENTLSTGQEGGEIPEPAIVPRGTPYMIWNKNNNQALCGHSNVQGYTQGYFVRPDSGWGEGDYLVQLKNEQSCSSARKAMSQLFNDTNSEDFEQAYAYARANFALTEKQQDSLVYQHADGLVHNKLADLELAANKKAIRQAADLAESKQDSAVLNSLGYSLGFDRQAYKQGLSLVTQALKIKPEDCYYLNSKGYLLMHQGDLKESLDYLKRSDVACQAARTVAEAGQRRQLSYPIAVNYAHLAENYALSGDFFLSNEFFNRSLKEGSLEAKGEIIEVAKSLVEKKVLNDENVKLLQLYLSYADKEQQAERQVNAPVQHNKSKKHVKEK